MKAILVILICYCISQEVDHGVCVSPSSQPLPVPDNSFPFYNHFTAATEQCRVSHTHHDIYSSSFSASRKMFRRRNKRIQNGSTSCFKFVFFPLHFTIFIIGTMNVEYMHVCCFKYVIIGYTCVLMSYLTWFLQPPQQ